jgi:hypothetical protein
MVRTVSRSRLLLELLERLGIVGEALEAAQLAEGLVDHHALVDGDLGVAHAHAGDAEGGLFVVLEQAVHQRVGGAGAVHDGQAGEGVDRVGQRFRSGFRQFGEGLHQ